MTPTLQALHEAHKARLARFALAAQHPKPVARPLTIIQPPRAMAKPAQVFVRRRYETKRRSFAGVPVAWRILRVVADEFDVTPADIQGPSRKDHFVFPRFVAACLFLEATNFSLNAIGRHLGGRDHTCVINARNRMKPLLAEEAFRNRFDQMKEEIGA